MRVFIAYKPASEYGREVSDYLRDFEHRTGKQLEEINPDTRDGDTICRLYDLVQYPSIVAVDSLGVMHNMWQGMPLPLMDEVSYYV